MLKSIVTMLIVITPTIGAEQDSNSEFGFSVTPQHAETPVTENPSLGDSSALPTKEPTHQRAPSQASLTPEQLATLEAKIKGEPVKGKTAMRTISPAEFENFLSKGSPQ
ncbi:MAG: hypothetical protein KF798_05230 [Candidatus Paracaedibacteraceae bacterium]|nr:hypothetical protein [Candidatus Paracaedibacteraceae bacterium]